MQKADHSGHRARMKKKLLEQGADVFEPHEVLEILLYYAIPQRNTNDIAKNLLDTFGSLSAVLDAPVSTLMNAGLTEHQALYLHMIPDITRLYMLDKYHNPKKVLHRADMAQYVIDRFIGYEGQEHILLILLDTKGKEVYSGIIAHGDFDSVKLSIRGIVTLAMNYGAVSAIVAHCHPSGNAMPSRDDILMTNDLNEALRMVKVRLLDHYIVADHDCVSMRESGYML